MIRATCRASVRPIVRPIARNGASGVTPGFDVIVLVGQSNMVGRNGPIDGVLDVTDARIFQLKKSDGTVALASDPLDHWDETADTVGLGLSFAKAYLATIPANRSVLLVPAADGGTAFNTGYWRDGGAGYEYAISACNAAMAAGDGVNRFIGVLWHQGESDKELLSQSEYAADLDALITAIRTEVTGASSTTPFVVGEINSSSTYYDAAIDAALEDTPSRVAYTAFVETDDLALGGDSVHFTAAASRTMGERYHTALVAAIANGPAVPDAIDDLTGEVGNAQVVLDWTAPTANHSAITDYIVQYKASSSGTWLTFADGTSTTSNATVTGLTNGTAYDFRVAAVNGVGTGAYSSSISKTPVSVDSDAAAYIALVEAEDGETLSPTISTAMNDLVVGMKSASMFTTTLFACLLRGPKTLAGALIPLRGSAPTNTGFIEGNYTQLSGLNGGGTRKLTSPLAGNATNQNDYHVAAWVNNIAVTSTECVSGNALAGTAGTSQINLSGTLGVVTRCKSGTATTTGTPDPTVFSGFIGISRSSSTEYILRMNGTNTTISVASNGNLATAMEFFSRASSSYLSGELSWISEGNAVDLEALDTLITAYMATVN